MSEPRATPTDAKAIFLSVCDLAPGERAAELDRRAAHDARLRAAVISLLEAHDRAGQFLRDPTVATVAATAAPASLPRHIGPYKILQEIGEGGFGTVYMAEQERPVRRRVALKVIKAGMDSRGVIARFEAERQALALMDHPNIARVFDAGTTDDSRPYFVMELVKGIPITEYCDKNNLGIRQRLELFAQVCQAVQHAHQKGIIHRDIKPNNVLVSTLDDKSLAKVIDFGIAKATQARLTEKTLFTEFRQLIGTPEYMSPEQAEGGLDIDTRTDVYALGVLLYELLCGTTPFAARELRSKAYGEMQRVIREVDPPKPSTRLSMMRDDLPTVAAHRGVEPRKLTTMVRGDLDWIVMKAIDKDRARRYETANGLAADVLRHLADEPVTASPPTNLYRLRKFVRRHRAPVTAGATILVLVVAGAALYVRGIRAEQRRTEAALGDAQRQRDEARRQRAQAEQANLNTQAVNDFLTKDVLGAADPALTQGREVTVKQALDNAAKAVGDTFTQRPLQEASVRHTVALTYDALGHTDVALPHARAALEIRRKLLGDDHPETVESVTVVALLLQYQGNFAEAEPLYRDAIARSRRLLGTDHPDTLHRMFNLASLLQDQGKFAEAERGFREVLQGRRRVLGDDHPDTAASLNYLASALRNQGKLDEAEPLNREALATRRRVLGNLHPSTLASINDMAIVLAEQGRLDEAEPLYREALANYRRVLGDDHPSAMISAHNLAVFLVRRGKFDESERLYHDVIERSRRVQGDDHPFTVAAMLNLGYLLGEEAKLAEAETVLREASKQCRRAYGEEHPTTLASINFLTNVLARERKFTDAEPLLAELHEKSLRAEGDPKQNARYASKYGLLLARVDRFSEAEKPLREAYDRLIATGQPNVSETRAVLRALAQVCQATGRADEATTLDRQLASLEAATRAAAGAGTAPVTRPALAPASAPGP